jgi:hypothetical protein
LIENARTATSASSADRAGIRDIGDAASIGRVQHGFHGMPVLLCVGGVALGRVTVASVVRRH